MIKFNNTKMSIAFSHYISNYISGRIAGTLDQFLLNGSSIIAVNRSKGELPKINLPYVLSPEDARNTTDLTLVMYDVAGVRPAEADLRYINALLTASWEDPLMAERFLTLRKFATKAYVTWVGRSLKSRHNFSIEDQIQIDIILAVFYYTAGGVASEMLSESKYKTYLDISEITMANASTVLTTVKKLGFNDLDHIGIDLMIEALRTISDDTRSKISLPALQSQLGGSWVGEGRVHYSNLALEYPPMFLSLLYTALTDRSYSRTPLSTVIQEFAVGRKSNVGEMFVRNLTQQISGYKIEQDINV